MIPNRESPMTSPQKPKYAYASTVSYANMGGFFGPELRFAGYDGLMITGKAASPVYLYINDDKVEIRDAEKFWGMGTDQFDKEIIEELDDPRFRTCYIGPGGENLIRYACILNTAARAAGRDGTGCVMGSKKLKAIAVKGTGQPEVGNHKLFIESLEETSQKFKDPKIYGRWRKAGTAEIISLGNVIGFLMEAYDKKLIDKKFLDGIDLKWGSVEATIEMIHRIAARKEIGDLVSKGVKALAEEVGQDSHKFAMHVKGHELAAHNCHANPPRALCYATANRGACHLNGTDIVQQNLIALADASGLCLFAIRGYGMDGKLMGKMLSAITGAVPSGNPMQIGERIFNLEKLFNYHEGFTRADDVVPDRFFEEPLTVGEKKGSVLTRDQFKTMMDDYYQQRGWDMETSAPKPEKLKTLGLAA